MDYVTSTSVSTVPGMTDLDSYPAFESTGSMIQCEIAALAQPQASDSASNLRFPSENIDHHAFPGKLPSSFLSNTFSSAENNAHSSSHRESHTIYGDNYWIRIQSQSTTILLIAIILITYMFMLRRFLLKYWRTIVSGFFCTVTVCILATLTYYFEFHYTVLLMLRPRVLPTIKFLKAIWDVTGPLIVIYLARRPSTKTCSKKKENPLVLVQNVEGTAEIKQELRDLRRDMDRVLNCILGDINVGVVRKNRENRGRVKQPEETSTPAPEPSTPQSEAQPEAPENPPTTTESAEEMDDVPLSQIKSIGPVLPITTTAEAGSEVETMPEPCTTCGYKGVHTCWQKVRCRTCWLCRQKTKQIETNYVNQRGNIVKKVTETPNLRAVKRAAENLNNLLRKMDEPIPIPSAETPTPSTEGEKPRGELSRLNEIAAEVQKEIQTSQNFQSAPPQ